MAHYLAKSLLGITLLISEGSANACFAEAAAQPVGTFVVVDARAASDVATTLEARKVDGARSFLGRTMYVDKRVTWTRENCELRSGGDGASRARVDRNLADLQIVIGDSDRRLNQAFVVDCLGRAIGDIWQVLAIDDRVLVARAGASISYLVLEKPLSASEALQVEQALKKTGIDPGEVDGVIDQNTRAALAAYARQRGSLSFASGILTRNLLDALLRDGAQ